MFRCRSIAAAGDSLSFASPKESKQRKGDPGYCVPALRCGQPAVLGPVGVPLELASLRQSRSLIRLPLRSSAHPQGFLKSRIRDRERVTARTNGFWGQIAISLRSEAKHPKGGPQAQGNLRSDPENARSRFLVALNVRVARQGACARWSRWPDTSTCPNRAPPSCPKGKDRHDGDVGVWYQRLQGAQRRAVPGRGGRKAQCSGARSARYSRNSWREVRQADACLRPHRNRACRHSN